MPKERDIPDRSSAEQPPDREAGRDPEDLDLGKEDAEQVKGGIIPPRITTSIPLNSPSRPIRNTKPTN